MGRPDSYHHFAGALGGCDPDEGEANKWIEWISGRMAWTVVGCEGWKPSRNRTAGSTVAGTPAPSSRLVGSPTCELEMREVSMALVLSSWQ